MTDQLRGLVPGWVEWLGPLLFLLGAAAVVGLVPVVAVRAALRRVDEKDHWTKQARYVHAARVSVVVAAVIVPPAVRALSTITVGPMAWLPEQVVGGAGALAAVLMIARLSWWMEGNVLRQPVPGWGRFLVGFLVRLIPATAIVLLGLGAPASLTSPWFVPWMVLAGTVAVSLRYQLELLAAFGLARPADENLVAMVGQAAVRVGLTPPRLFLIESHQPNAFAFPWRGAVAFTTRAVAELSAAELESVALHELGHLAESTASARLRQAAHFIWIPIVAVKPILGSLGTGGLLILIAVLGGLLIAVRRFGAKMEARSDLHAIGNVEQADVYGKALEKVYRIGYLPAVLHRPSHGQLHERLEGAGVEVEFDPPSPPPVRMLIASSAVAILVCLGIGAAPYVATIGSDLSSPVPAQVALSLGSYGSWPFERLGQLADFDQDFETAERFYSAAVDMTTDPDPLVDLVYVRSALGWCAEAEEALASLAETTVPREDLSLVGEWVKWCLEQSNPRF